VGVRRLPALAAGLAGLLGLGLALGAAAAPDDVDARFRAANDLARSGDYPKAIAGYQELAGTGVESASLYWNWAQAAAGHGAAGEALWALLRAREIEPGDAAVQREIERLRESAHLDAAEIAPDPLAALRRASRRWHIDLAALVLLAGSCVCHLILRLRRAARWPARAAGFTLAAGMLLALVSIAGAWARPTGVVIRRGAPLLDAASPTAEAVGSLREGEVLPLLATSGGYVQVEDSSGARGWAAADDVRPLAR
jgi:hypothetical protein